MKFQGTRREPFRLDLVPMINVVFLLLIFFMLTSTFSKSNKDVDLPEAVSSNEVSKKNLILKVSKNDEIELDGSVVGTEMLLAHLREKLKLNEKAVVEVLADKNIKFEQFGRIIGIAKQAGIEEFIFMTEVPKG